MMTSKLIFSDVISSENRKAMCDALRRAFTGMLRFMDPKTMSQRYQELFAAMNVSRIVMAMDRREIRVNSRNLGYGNNDAKHIFETNLMECSERNDPMAVSLVDAFFRSASEWNLEDGKIEKIISLLQNLYDRKKVGKPNLYHWGTYESKSYS